MAKSNVKFVGNTSTLPISTILYMTEADLQERLKILTNLFKLEYAYIVHKGEDDEAKDHIHFITRPKTNGFKNISKIRECLFEIVDKDTENYKVGQSKPCKPFVESKSIVDWHDYSIHDEHYLESKGETRKYHYCHEDIKGDISFIEDMTTIKKEQNRTSDFEFIVCLIESGASDFEILSKFNALSCTDISHALKSITEIRKMLSPDLSNFDKSIDEIFPYFEEYFEQRTFQKFSEKINMYKTLDDFSHKDIYLNKRKIFKHIIKKKMLEITEEDVIQAMLEK